MILFMRTLRIDRCKQEKKYIRETNEVKTKTKTKQFGLDRSLHCSR